MPAGAEEASAVSALILPENLPPRQAGNACFPQRRSFVGMPHRSSEPCLEPEGKALPAVHHQLVLAPILARHPRLRLRSCRRPLQASPASGRYACHVRSSTGSRPPWRRPRTVRRRSSSPCSWAATGARRRGLDSPSRSTGAPCAAIAICRSPFRGRVGALLRQELGDLRPSLGDVEHPVQMPVRAGQRRRLDRRAGRA